jgi:peroxiredoxin
MTISINDNFPNQELRILIDGEVQNINSADYFSGKKIVLVGVPGAFTPTCHLSHLPGYTLRTYKNLKIRVTTLAL